MDFFNILFQIFTIFSWVGIIALEYLCEMEIALGSFVLDVDAFGDNFFKTIGLV